MSEPGESGGSPTPEREALLLEILHRIPHRIFVKSADGRFRFANEALAAELGCPVTALEGAHQRDVSPDPEDAAKVLADDREVMEGARPKLIDEEQLTDASGKRRSYQTMKIPIVDPLTGSPAVLGVAVDVSAQKDAERLLRESERRFRAAFHDAPIGLALADRALGLFQVNRALAVMLDCSPKELKGRALTDCVHPEDRAALRERLCAVFESGEAGTPFECRFFESGRAKTWGLVSVSAVAGDEGDTEYLVLQIQNVTESRELSLQLSYQATHDDLTGLINRRECKRRMDQLIESARTRDTRHAFCYLDLDQFKVVNDTHGHAAGDRLLHLLGHRLSKSVRERDTVARLGGDEFGILFENCTLEDAKSLAAALVELVREFRCPWGEQVLRVGASVGLVEIDARSESVEAVMRAADVACFGAKELGRDRVYTFDSEDAVLARQRSEMAWVGRIQAALDSDRFALMAQPVVGLCADGVEPRAELLVRLIDEDGVHLLPGAFLPAAERYGLAVHIDRWVVERICRLVEAGAPCTRGVGAFHVNLSGQSLGDASFHEWIGGRLAAAGESAHRLCFEITETAMIRDIRHASRLIDELSALGCEFVLDDFGSGLSSFGYLRSLPVAAVKIDGQFVRDMADDPIDRAMVRAICDVARLMGKLTIAEGVESEALLEPLRALGVDYVQGVAIGEPRPLEGGVSGDC